MNRVLPLLFFSKLGVPALYRS